MQPLFRETTAMSPPTSETKGAAIVTGAAQGIGLAIAIKLAEDGYGLVINDLPSKESALAQAVESIVNKGGKAIAASGDVSVEEDVKNLVQKAVQVFGRLDVVRFISIDANLHA
jgi:NAD(P)-dependent dehydrogenase (short-subunit alcohol dehydrogenase family)